MTSSNSQGTRVFFEAENPSAEVFPLATGTVGIFSCVGPDKATPNEDAAAIIPYGPNGAVLVVADGLGGSPAGEQASRIAVEVLVAVVEEAARESLLLRDAIIDAIEEANREIQEAASGSGTTLAIVEIQGDEVRPYHVGDSMIQVVGQRGRVKLQTISHSPVGYAVEAGVLDENDAMSHEDRHVVSNVLGSPEMRIELGPTMRLAARDTLVLATDGLFDNLQTDEITEYVRKGKLSNVVDRMSSICRQRMLQPSAGDPSKPDDLTFVVFRRTG